jgi:hypothetical protein
MVIAGEVGAIIGDNVVISNVGAGDCTDDGVVIAGKEGAIIGTSVGSDIIALVGIEVDVLGPSGVGANVNCGASVGVKVTFPPFLDFFPFGALEVLDFPELFELFEMSFLPSIRVRINKDMLRRSQRNS